MTGCLQYIVWDVAPDLYVAGMPIHLYGIFFALGLLVGGMAVIHLMRRYTASQSYLIYAFVGILIGARLFHCLFYDPMYYASHLAEIFLPIEEEGGKMVFGGFRGLASHGGVVGLMVALAIFARRNGLNYLEVCDIFAVATPLTGGFVRLGNMMNSEILGIPTASPMAFVFKYADNIPHYPVALYEALWYFALFVLLWFVYRAYGNKHRLRGLSMGIACTGVAVFRFFIEFIKENQECYTPLLPINMGQMLSIPFVVAGVWLIVAAIRRRS